MAMQRAQDKIAQMQARAGAVDELLASGALTDLTGSSDPIQAELDKASQSGQVDAELAQLKGQLAAGAPAGALGAAGKPAEAAPEDDKVVDAEPEHDEPAEPAPKTPDPFTLEDKEGES
jgi:phage shock protein A